MKPLKPVKRATLGEQVAVQIAEMIGSGEWSAGQRLPSEAELCRSLGVGRSTVREALTSLAFVGIVEMRAGDGTFVAQRRSIPIQDLLKGSLPGTENAIRDLAEARIAIETETAALCAQCGRETDFKLMDGLLTRMGNALHDPHEFRNLDIAFHLAIADGSQNSVFAHLLRIIRTSLEDYIGRSLRMFDSGELTLHQHAAILEALRARDSKGAGAAMRAHLLTFLRGYAIVARIAETDAANKDGQVALAL